MSSELPSISIVIPTLNSERPLRQCLKSILEQDYPKEKLELILVDAGSTDKTLSIAREHGIDKILPNPRRTGEAGKAVGVKVATNEIIALIDSDNILDGRDWLRRMVEPFQDEEIVGTEPLHYAYRADDGFITRYSALLGMNDPLCLYLGNYDRYSAVTGKWTEVPLEAEDMGNFLKLRLTETEIPTMGANGFLVRRSALLECPIGDYLFDIDVVYEMVKRGKNHFGKVKIGIVHLFSGDVRAFVRKQRRRVQDYLYYDSLRLRTYPWGGIKKRKLARFLLSTILLFPLLWDALRGYRKVRDPVWLFHPLACWLTLLVYGTALLEAKLLGSRIADREGWGLVQK